MENKLLPTHAEMLAKELREKIASFKKEHQYLEALACIENIFEINQYDNDLIYEKAEIYYLMGSYTDSFNWLKQFVNHQGPDYRSYLLHINLQFKLGNKDEAVKVLANMFEGLAKGYFTLPDEEALQHIDKVITKFKKIYKWDKLTRLCPAIKQYQSQRRKMLKRINAEQISQVAEGAKLKGEATSGAHQVNSIVTGDVAPKTPKATENPEKVETTEAPKTEETPVTAPTAEDTTKKPIASEAPLPISDKATEAAAVDQEVEAELLEATTIETADTSVEQANENAEETTPSNHQLVPTKGHALAPLPPKEVTPPIIKALQDMPKATPEATDEYKMSFEELCELIQELWAKGRLSHHDRKRLLYQDIHAIDKAILQQVLSLRKKIWLYSYVANVFRQTVMLEDAIFFLRQGLLLDDEDSLLLKNLGYLLIANGEYAVAKQILEDSITGEINHRGLDYTTLDLISQCKDKAEE